MKIERVLMDTTKSYQARFGIRPKTFNTVNVCLLIGKFVMAMLHTKMFLIAKVNKTVITAPSVRVDYAFKGNLSSDNPLKGCP